MVSFGFFNSSNGDRKYSADDVSRIFSYLITDGVLMTYGDKFFTTPATANLGVVLGTGWAWFNHTWTQSDTAIPFELDEPDPSLDRFDTVYLKVDRRSLGRMNSLGVVKGTAAINPVVPTFPTETDVFYHPLAYVKVRHGVTRIAASDIEILVGKTQAPFITSILQTTDITTLFQGWSEQFGTKMTTWQSGYDAKMTEWENEIDTLETSLTSNVNALITSGNQQLQTQQTQFATQLSNQQTTFTNSLSGWETDFQTWFDNLQTYLSEDVVTEIWADLQALEMKNTEQDTAINGKLGLNQKATTAQVNSGASGNIWMDPKQIADKINAMVQGGNTLLPKHYAGSIFLKGSSNYIRTVDALSMTYSSSSVSQSGVIACPLAYNGGIFLGWFVTKSKFCYTLMTNSDSATAPTPIPKYVDFDSTQTSATLRARFIPIYQNGGLLLLQGRISGSEKIRGYLIRNVSGSMNVRNVFSIADNVNITSRHVVCATADYIILDYAKNSSNDGFVVYYISYGTNSIKSVAVGAGGSLSDYVVPTLYTGSFNTSTLGTANMVFYFVMTTSTNYIRRITCSVSFVSGALGISYISSSTNSAGNGFSAQNTYIWMYGGSNYGIYIRRISGTEYAVYALRGSTSSVYIGTYTNSAPESYLLCWYDGDGVPTLLDSMANIKVTNTSSSSSPSATTIFQNIAFLGNGYSQSYGVFGAICGGDPYGMVFPIIGPVSAKIEQSSSILSCVGGIIYTPSRFILFQVYNNVISYATSNEYISTKIVLK